MNRLVLAALLLACVVSAQADPIGFYTDKPSYAPTDKVYIHANWNTGAGPLNVSYHLRRVNGPGWEAATPLVILPITYPSNTFASQKIKYGSFVEVENISLDDLISFTLRGYIRPAFVDGYCAGGSVVEDDTGLAGQLWLDPITGERKGTGFGITKNGEVFARVETDGNPSFAQIIGPKLAQPPAPWVRIKMVYDITGLTLEVEPDGGMFTPQTASVNGRVVVPPGKRFLIGARNESPGNLTGCFSGRIDSFRLTGKNLQVPDGMIEPLVPNFIFNFEDNYGSTVKDTSGYHHDGAIVGHGTPGVEGRLNTQGLRLNHDQVFDAQFSTFGAEIDLALLTPLPSGLYAIEATGTGATEPQWQCFVIRPTMPTAPVAAIVPVNTWMAYNGWPGDPFDATKNPTELAIRTACLANSPGNNSAYGIMGDGVSENHYVGWRRPCSRANPFLGEPVGTEVFSVHAAAAAQFFEWLDDFAATWSLDYDVYSDWDLDQDGTNGPVTGAMSSHTLLFTMAHHEYWSQGMMQRLNDFAGRGGSLINVGGNLFAYRAERSGDALEIKAWPVRLNANRIQMQGPRDAQSLIHKGEWTGLWRVLNQCAAGTSFPAGATADFVLGTIPDIVGPEAVPPGFSLWEPNPTATSHWLWASSPPSSFGTSAGLGFAGTVGHEGDSYVRGVMEMSGITFLSAKAGTLTVLARACCDDAVSYVNYPGPTGPGMGTGHGLFSPFTASPTYAAYNCILSDLFDLTTIPINLPTMPGYMSNFQLTVNLNTGSAGRNLGSIVYYCHTGGGRVLSVPATACPWALGSPGDTVVKDMVERAARCILNKMPPANCGCPPNDAPR